MHKQNESSFIDTFLKSKKTLLIALLGLLVMVSAMAGCGGGEVEDEDEEPYELHEPEDVVVTQASPTEISIEDFVPPTSPSDLNVDHPPHSLITPEEARNRLNSDETIILLDVRSEEEFLGEHIPGAILIPMDELARRAETELADQGRTIIVYCRTGNRSDYAARLLAGLGYVAVYDLGGIVDWPFDTVAG